MSNVQSYNALIDRFKAFASGHFILKTFSHGQIDTADLEKFTEYPFMHVVPSNVSYAKGTKTFSFQIVLADLPRDKDDKVEFQREVLSDLQRIAEDLVAEITNHRVLFGDLITVQNVSLEPFLEEFHNTLTGWTISLDLLVPYYWDACSIPAEWNDFFESSTGGTGSILTFINSINRDANGNVSLVNDQETPSPNYYYGTDDEGVRGWYLLDTGGGLTCETIGSCQTIIDIEAAIDLLQQDVIDLNADVALKADITSISAVGFSNDYNDLDNLPTIPTLTSDLTNDGADGVNPFITAQDLPDTSGFVPYTGATQDVDLGEFELNAGQVEFDQTPTGAAGVAVMRWNDTDGTLDLGLKGGNVTLQVGQESVLRVVNKTATNVNLLEANYQAVRVTGVQGQRLKVDLALATTDPLSAETIGLVTETINNNQEGFITTSGLVRGINTTGSLQGETWADGDILYLSPTTAGNATKVKPVAPNHLIILGYVIYAHINQGSIFVKVDNGYELDELHNVKITTPANNNVLAYTSATDIWENKTVATALGYTPVPETRTLTINGTTQDLSADRTFTIATGLTVGTTPITSGTIGRVLFQGTGNVLQQSGSLFWDNTNSRLGIDTTAPISKLNVLMAAGSLPTDVRGRGIVSEYYNVGLFGGKGGIAMVANGTKAAPTAVAIDHNASFLQPVYYDGTKWRVGSQISSAVTAVTNNVSVSSDLRFNTGTVTGDATLGGFTGLTEVMRIGANGNVLINTTTDAGFKLDVNGTARVQGNAQFGTGFYWDNTNSRLGIGTASPSERLHIVQTATGSNNSVRMTCPSQHANIISFFNADNSSQGSFLATGSTFGFGLYQANQTNLIGGSGGVALKTSNGANAHIRFHSGNANIDISPEIARFVASSGNLLLNTTTDAGFKLDVNGTARVSGAATITAQTKIGTTVYADTSCGLILGRVGVSNASRGFLASETNYQDFGFCNTSISAGNINAWTFGQRQDTYFGNSLGSFQIVGGYFNNAGTGSMVGGGFRVPLICNPDGTVIIAGASSNAINGNVLVGTTTNVASSKLTIESTTQGFLPPRQTLSQRTAIASPAVGLIVYQTDMVEGLYIYKSTGWTFVI
jgi:hypothetical protein